jgi:hypothetical protein
MDASDRGIVDGLRAFIRESAGRWIRDGSNSDGVCHWCGELTGGVDPDWDPHRPDCALVAALGGVGGIRRPICHRFVSRWTTCDRELPCPDHPAPAVPPPPVTC